jgi:site-specific DNA-methyltransferase (adenine-specific)
MIELLNCDCMEYMKGVPDKFFELAIVDPPYGIGEGNKKNKTRSGFTGFGENKKWVKAKDYGGGEFDDSIPGKQYFDELKRISINQIIWGANYMVEYLPPSMGWIVWDKDNGDCDQSDCELAFSSFNRGLRKYKFKWQGLLRQNMKDKEERIHPTQKPVQLYKWVLKNYAKDGDKIFDSHLGSGSSAIAAYKYNFDFVGCEIDKDYYDAAVKRYNNAIMQQSLF